MLSGRTTGRLECIGPSLTTPLEAPPPQLLPDSINTTDDYGLDRAQCWSMGIARRRRLPQGPHAFLASGITVGQMEQRADEAGVILREVDCSVTALQRDLTGEGLLVKCTGLGANMLQLQRHCSIGLDRFADLADVRSYQVSGLRLRMLI